MSAPTANTLIDAVNERDEEVGTVRRGDVLREKRNFRTAHVFVINRRGELLLQRLAGKRRRHPGRWGSSVAAYLFAGETYRHGAERRMQEELGIGPELGYLGKTEMRDAGSLKFVELFLAHSDTAAIREPDHIAELRYWPPDRISSTLRRTPEDFTPTFAHLFREFASRLG
jgi:isopentenyl-diphosphate Delta-isomerase